MTLEKGECSIWNESTLGRLARGEWDEGIEAVMIGTNEDEGTMFAYGMGVSFTSPSLCCFPCRRLIHLSIIDR